MQLPWKRHDDDDSSMFPVKQSEFPLWVENKEYTHYHSPTTTFLGMQNYFIFYLFYQIFYSPFFILSGGLDRKSQHPSVIDMFPSDGGQDSASGATAEAVPSSSFVVTVTIPEEEQAKDHEDKDPKV